MSSIVAEQHLCEYGIFSLGDYPSVVRRCLYHGDSLISIKCCDWLLYRI